MLVSAGYPGEYEKGKVISSIEQVKNALVFHAGTARNEAGEIISNGGRVIAVTALGSTLKNALELSNLGAHQISFSNKYYRRDIGFEFID